MSPRFATATLRTRTRGLGLPMVVALSLIAIVDRGHVRHDGRDRPLAGRHVRAQRSTSQMTADALGLERLMVDLETGVRGYMLTDDARFLEPYRTARTQLDDRLDGLAAVAPPSLRPRIDRITRDVDAYVRDYTEPLIIDHSGNVLAATTEGKRRLDGLRREFAALSSAQAAITGGRRDRSQALRHRMLVLAASGAALSALLLVGLGLGLRRVVLLPVRRVARAAERLSKGKLDTRVPANGYGEIGQLGDSVQPDGRGAQRARARSERADRSAAVDPRLHDDDDLGQGPRRPLPARQRRVAPRDGPGRRRRHRPHRRRASSRRRSPRPSASPISTSCAAARPRSTSATPRPTAAHSSW